MHCRSQAKRSRLTGKVAGASRSVMRRSGVTILAAVAWLALSLPALGNPLGGAREQDRTSPYMRVYGVSQPPYGFVDFCRRMPQECAQGPVEEQRLSVTPERLIELDHVNRTVNHEIAPATDLEVYGVAEYWTIPTTRGDCEDYALLKRKRLMDRGWPASALLMTVVRDDHGEGHAVLTARTVQGDFILDNKVDEIRIWYRFPYEYIMRQSYLNPQLWMSLDPNQASPEVLSGMQTRP
jgi:predicted transglutaminase-like cysteine proteinase